MLYDNEDKTDDVRCRGAQCNKFYSTDYHALHK